MKPIFADLGSEIQRSLGFYNNSNPNTKLARIIALGGGTKMRGLLKYLQQTLQIPTERPDSFKKLRISSGVSAAKFHDSVCDFGVVYGLALQGLGLARLENNLLPRSIARSMSWASKAKYFTAAALVLLAVSLMCLGRTLFDKANYSNKANKRQEIKNIIKAANNASEKLQTHESKGAGFEKIIQKEFEPFKHRNAIPQLYQTIISALPNEKNNPEQVKLYKAFAGGDVETILKIPRRERKQIFITSISAYFSNYIEEAPFNVTEFEKGARGSRKKTKQAPVDDGFGFIDDGMGMFGGGGFSPATRSRKIGAAESKDEENAGFVVTITGYSPYKKIGELMDPAGIKDDQSKWGFITRLMHLDKIADGNSVLELYKKTEVKHFKLETGEVSIDAKMPAGIGIEDIRYNENARPKKAKRGRTLQQESAEEVVLIDPMTKEIISKATELDEFGRAKIDRLGNVVYNVNDHWFILNVKFIWKDAPKKKTNSA